MARRRPVQQELRFRTRGGKRPGAGRKPRADRVGFVAHVPRPAHDLHHPVHISMRAAPRSPNLRSQVLIAIIKREIAHAVGRGHRVLHFSVQDNHLHLIVEGDERASLGRRMQRLGSRIARLVNLASKRRGSLWRDRYHRQDIASPRQMRNALVYVLFNERKHRADFHTPSHPTIDTCSSMIWFTDWHSEHGPPKARVERWRSQECECPVAKPKTWLARVGWKRHGLIRFDGVPSTAKSGLSVRRARRSRAGS